MGCTFSLGVKHSSVASVLQPELLRPMHTNQCQDIRTDFEWRFSLFLPDEFKFYLK